MTDYHKRGYLLEDFHLFHLRSDSGTRTEYHYHEFHKLLLLVSGTGGYIVDGKRYSLQSGDIVLVGSECIHQPEFDMGTPYERIIIYISPEFLHRESAAGCDLTECFSGKWGHVLRAAQAEQKRLFSLASALERELSEEEYGREILSNGLLLRLLVQIGRHLRRKDADRSALLTPKDERILTVIRHIDSHLAEDISIDILAERVYLSKYHMMRLFRQETGITIYTYLTQKRLLLARDRIRTGMSATEACYRCGWRSYSSFTRAYAKQFGTTPTGRRDTAGPQMESLE